MHDRRTPDTEMVTRPARGASKISRGRTLGSSRRRFLCALSRDRERFGKFRGIFSTGLSHLRPPTAAAAGCFRGFADPVAGLETLGDQVVADGGDEGDFAVAAAGEHDGEAGGF